MGFLRAIALVLLGGQFLRLGGLRSRMRKQAIRATGVYERPRLDASAGSSNNSADNAQGNVFVVSFSLLGDRFSCACGILFFLHSIFGWIQTTLNMLGEHGR